uniref:Major facilitator superfamily (MFS) profile domain-containing protein n=1 Tax=Parascaris univalens TaxID=6257 RepID=A0A914ZSZ6_PARUN
MITTHPLLSQVYSKNEYFSEMGEAKSKSGISEDGKRYVPLVDGGWGWVVVVGSFFIHVFADGIVYSFGVLFDVIMKEFNATNAEAATIISLLTGLTLSTGPIASALTNKFGCRITTILGSIIAACGCAASHFATSVGYLMISVGCVMGIGFGLMYCPAIVIVTMYFEKKRALATGMAVCGAGIGTVLFAPVSETLVRLFSWRFVFLVYTGFVLLCVGCGAVFRPLQFVPVDDEAKEGDDGEKKKEGIDEKKEDELLGNGNAIRQNKQAVEKKLLLNGEMRTAWSVTGVDRAGRTNSPIFRKRLNSLGTPSASAISESTGYITVKDVFYSGSVTAIPHFVENRDKYRSLTSLSRSRDKKNRSLEAVDEEGPQNEANRMREIWRTLVKMTDLTLLLDPIFLLFAISNLLTSVAFNSPLVFLPVHAERLGCTPIQAARVISIFGIFNTVGRILFGLVSDRQFPTKYGKDTARNRLWIYNISLSICGILTMLVFVCKDFFALAAYSGLFGLTLSSYVCLTSVLLVDLLGLERLTNAFGLLLLFQGIGTIFGPPTAGRLADVSGSYHWSFVFCGVCLLISGLMLFVVPSVKAKMAKAKLHSETIDIEKLSPSTDNTVC